MRGVWKDTSGERRKDRKRNEGCGKEVQEKKMEGKKIRERKSRKLNFFKYNE